MSYLPPPFEHDIFISYAHVDDQPSPGKSEGWVTLFHKYLELELSKRFGRIGTIEIWRDTEELGGSTYFDDAIRSGIQKTGIFLALTSRGYLSPEGYCQRELAEFYDAADNGPYGLRVGNNSRLFNILLQNIHWDEWPEAFKGTSGLPFHNAQRKEIGQPLRQDTELFEEQLHKLVNEVETTLRALKELSPQPIRTARAEQTVQEETRQEEAAATTDFTIFLAHTEGALRGKRGRIIQDLQRHGINVITDIPPPFAAAEHQTKVAAAISEADLSVHLLDEAPGLPVDGEPDKSYFQKQVEIGIKSGGRQLIWMPKSLDIQSVEDEPHRKFLDHIENGKRDEATYELIRETHGAISREVLALVEKIKQERASPCPAATAPAAALVDMHLKDQLYAFDLSPVLAERRMEALIRAEIDAPQSNMNSFQETLKRVSVLIIIFGHVTSDWVLNRLLTAVQTYVTEKCPLKFLGIYYAPVGGDEKQKELNVPLSASLPIVPFNTPEKLAGFLDAFIGR